MTLTGDLIPVLLWWWPPLSVPLLAVLAAVVWFWSGGDWTIGRRSRSRLFVTVMVPIHRVVMGVLTVEWEERQGYMYQLAARPFSITAELRRRWTRAHYNRKFGNPTQCLATESNTRDYHPERTHITSLKDLTQSDAIGRRDLRSKVLSQ